MASFIAASQAVRVPIFGLLWHAASTGFLPLGVMDQEQMLFRNDLD